MGSNILVPFGYPLIQGLDYPNNLWKLTHGISAYKVDTSCERLCERGRSGRFPSGPRYLHMFDASRL